MSKSDPEAPEQAATAAEAPVAEPERADRGSARLHQPWRAALAGAELVGAAALVACAFLAWGESVVRIELPQRQGVGSVSRIHGNWVALAVASATLAGVLLVNAVKQVVLSRRGRNRRRSRRQAGEQARTAPPAGED